MNQSQLEISVALKSVSPGQAGPWGMAVAPALAGAGLTGLLRVRVQALVRTAEAGAPELVGLDGAELGNRTVGETGHVGHGELRPRHVGRVPVAG